jgi:site-specific DNA recombinase
LAFETYRTGNASYDDVADVLNAAGYRSRTPRGRVLWNKHSVAELLRNETYTGVVMIKGKRIEGHHPAIVSREVFDQVTAIRRKRFHHQATFNRKYRVYLFVGILRCVGCGRVMRASTRGKSERLCYHCTSRELKHTCTSSNVWVYEDTLAAQFAHIVAQIRLPDDWQARISELVNGNGKRAQREADRRALTDRLARIKKQFEWGDLTEQEYRAKRDEIQSALAACNPPSAQVIINAAEYLQNIARVWNEATATERREIVLAVFDEIMCDPDARRLTALRPKPAFIPLLRQVHGLVERGGVFEIQAESAESGE